MTRRRYLLLGGLLTLFAGMAAAQTVTEPPRFDGSRATASSAAASRPEEPQGTAGNLSNQALQNALIGAAMQEAAREEGRYFVEERRSTTGASDLD